MSDLGGSSGGSWSGFRLVKRRLSDAGATLVEYALVIALLAVVSIPAAQYITDGTREQVNNEASCVARRPPPPDCQIPSVPVPVPPDEDELPPDDGDPIPPPGAVTWTHAGIPADGVGNWGVSMSIHAANADGPIANAYIRIEARVTNPGGIPVLYLYCTTDAAGNCSLEYRTSDPSIRAVTLKVDAVTSDPPAEDLPGPASYSV